MEYFKITRRCIRCRKPLREDNTCQNPECVRYTPPREDDKADKTESKDTK